MSTDFWGNRENFKEILNSFGQCTGDYYFLYEDREKKVYFSDNVCGEAILNDGTEPVCTIKEWWKLIDDRDSCRVRETIRTLLEGRACSCHQNYRIRNRIGKTIWVHSNCRSYYDKDGNFRYIFGRLSITEEERQNVNAGNKELKKEIKQRILNLEQGFLMFLGIDNMKAVNLSRGRDFGDGILEDVGRVLRDELSGDNRIYRLNGDCFAFHCGLQTADEIRGFFAKIQERLEGECTVSVGCVSYLDYHVDDGGTLLQYAETALEQSKVQGKDRLTFFLPEDYEKNIREMELREELKQSIENGFQGFFLCYQPQVYTETGQIYGAEALLRYKSERRGVISPEEFIPVLEQSGMICPAGLWVLKKALTACRKFRMYLPEFHMSVNISYAQLNELSIGEDVLDAVRESAVPGSALTIEVTESSELSDYPHVNELFWRWKREGISISVDDFGTGYSSLGRLKNMEVDEIKIDRCFVRGIQNSAYNYRLLSNIIELADSSMIHVCCEGIEELEELQVLRELHPRLLQGYLVSRPVDEAAFIPLLEASAQGEPLLGFQEQNPREEQQEEQLRIRKEEAVGAILDAENDVYYLSDMDTYELYYLNLAGQKLFGVRDYSGRKCYRVLNGRDEPCPFCTNDWLCQDRFYIWERQNDYCERHFILKDKMIQMHGKRIRLEVAKDITRREYVSRGVWERLKFAETITGYMNTLQNYSDYGEAVEKVLASVGEFYQADRGYLFEQEAANPGFWHNTFEWCAQGVEPQKHGLQNVTEEVLERWLPFFENNESVILLNIEPLREIHPLEWELLNRQGIQRLIAVPIRNNGRTIGFLGVDNPRYCIHDDSQIRVLAGFLLTRMRQDHNESRYQKLLQSTNQDLLEALQVGIMAMDLDENGHPLTLTVSDKLEQLMGLKALSDEECCQMWYDRLPDDDRKTMDAALQRLLRTGTMIQQEYLWNHPVKGYQRFRVFGILMEDTPGCRKMKGYMRLLESAAE